MSFTDRLVLWLHVGFVIFAIGPVAVAISSTPRYIRRRDLPVVRYLSRITTAFTIASLGVIVMGIVLAQEGKDFSRPWLTASMTLYLVAVVLLVLIIRDQRKAIKALDGSVAVAAGPATATAAGPPAPRSDSGRCGGVRCASRCSGSRDRRPVARCRPGPANGGSGRRSRTGTGDRCSGRRGPGRHCRARPDRHAGRRGQPDLADHSCPDDLERLSAAREHRSVRSAGQPSAARRSSSRSSQVSMPTDSRIRSAGTSRDRKTSG